MNIEDNLWVKNGYRIGDILVGYRRSGDMVSREIKEYDVINNEYIKVRDAGFVAYYRRVAWNSTWNMQQFKFKAQDYIENISNPTQTELSLISLQFPEIDIEEFLKQIKQLTKEQQ